LARVAVAVAVIAAASLAWLHPWTRPAPAPPNYRAFTQVTGVQLLSATTAFVLTQSTESPGHFIGYATTDGGKDWRRFGVPPTSDIHFVDALHGFGATEGSLLASADGGRSWEARTLPPGQRFAGAAWFLDADHGWYLNLEVLSGTGLPRDMYRTQDGGRTWQQIWHGTSGSAQLPVFADPLHGWMVTDLTLLATNDGGESWAPVPAPLLDSWSRVRVAQGAVIEYSSALQGPPGQGYLAWRVATSSDGGASWSRIVEVPGIGIIDVAFADARPWRASAHYEVWRTDDGGQTWQPVATRLPAGAWLASSSYLDPEHGWALGGGGNLPFATRVLRTADGGGSWTPVAGPWATS
jgi:photosystem II stability/assembly factor-like uncharacterized protein